MIDSFSQSACAIGGILHSVSTNPLAALARQLNLSMTPTAGQPEDGTYSSISYRSYQTKRVFPILGGGALYYKDGSRVSEVTDEKVSSSLLKSLLLH
jgi:hypothetical protein